jgi:hypothetical protein
MLSSVRAGLTIYLIASPLLLKIFMSLIAVVAIVFKKKLRFERALVVGSLVYSALILLSGSVFRED